MKRFIDFTVWQWRRWDGWQKAYTVSLLLVIVGTFWTSILGLIMLLSGLAVLFVWLVKWALWDPFKQSYQEFKKEKMDES